jgi:hypothetical protein
MDQVINLILGSKKHAHHEGPSAELVWLRVVEVTKELKVRQVCTHNAARRNPLSRCPHVKSKSSSNRLRLHLIAA